MAKSLQIQKGFAEVNGTRLYYEVAGEGHPLVLNHGGLVDHHLWDDQFEEFARHFKTIRYDIRGYGISGLLKKDMEPYSLENDLRALLQSLGIERTYLMGLSMGGGSAIDFTLQYPEVVDALITVGASLSGFEWDEESRRQDEQSSAEGFEAFKSGDIPRAVELSLRFWTDGPNRTPDQVDPVARERIRVMTTRNFVRADDEDAEPIGMTPPAAGRLAEIHVPTLVIVGGEDVRGIRTIADVLVKDIAGAKKAVIPDAAHHPNVEKPQEFNRAVIEFLESL